MTTNQIAFQNLVETKRHNLATEQQNAANLAYQYAYLGESGRHNVATESEASRHNQSQEQLQAWANALNKLSIDNNYALGLEQNEIRWNQQTIDRQNAITNRINSETAKYNAEINQQNAETNAYNASTNAKSVENSRILGFFNYALAQDNYNLNRDKFEWQQFTDDAGIRVNVQNANSNATKAAADIIKAIIPLF